MRVLQLIDSLEAGGAERMAVNLANALVDQVEGSYLCATRAEGLLKASIQSSVNYIFLKKRSTFDLVALYKLCKFVRTENISIIHAHSSSYFLGTLVKLLNPKVKLVWHDHHGQSEHLSKRPYKVLQFCSRWFNLVFCVNNNLVTWNRSYLKTSDIMLLSNFVIPYKNVNKATKLKGTEGSRILCLANLRSQKDHFTLLKAFKDTQKQYTNWTLHLVGKDFDDTYSDELKRYIKDEHLETCVFLYGSKVDTEHIMSQCEIGVLSSVSEGLPLVLIEYGLCSLAVVATDVGDCSSIIKNDITGHLIEHSNVEVLSIALSRYIEDVSLRNNFGNALRVHVKHHFSKTAIIQGLMLHYKTTLKA